MRWTITSARTVLTTHPFSVEELRLATDNGPASHPYHRLHAPDWVNVLPVTSDGDAILIRQDRVGAFRAILETPGGTVDPGDSDPESTIIRELEEETGLQTPRLIRLGRMNPNPAIMSNAITFFLALDCSFKPDRTRFPEESEHITLERVPLRDLERLARDGSIDHCLSAFCVLLAMPRLHERGLL